MENKPTIEVFILTYNRPDTLVVAIDSVLKQTYPNIDLIVSDNSTNDETYKVLSDLKSWGSYKYLRRNPSMSGVEHLVSAINEASTDYFMVFHDDDEMLPDLVEELYNTISVDERYVGAGANAYVVKNGKKKVYSSHKNAVIQDGEVLIKRYVDKTIAPFPSYMYHRKVMGDIRPDYDKQGGKYCDVSFLFNLAQHGPILYVGKPLMIYNLHPEQDSAHFDFLKHIQLTNYLIKNIHNKSLINDYRIYQIYKNVVYNYKQQIVRFRLIIVNLFIRNNSYKLLLKYIIRFIQSICYNV